VKLGHDFELFVISNVLRSCSIGIDEMHPVPGRYNVFAKDYYFMMGDHRMTSQDSRIIGPIADDHIIGKATHILWSVNPEPDASHQFRWNRILKRLK